MQGLKTTINDGLDDSGNIDGEKVGGFDGDRQRPIASYDSCEIVAKVRLSCTGWFR